MWNFPGLSNMITEHGKNAAAHKLMKTLVELPTELVHTTAWRLAHNPKSINMNTQFQQNWSMMPENIAKNLDLVSLLYALMLVYSKWAFECEIPRTQANSRQCESQNKTYSTRHFQKRAPFTLTLSKIQRETLMFREQTCNTKHWGSFVWNSMHLYQRVYAFSNYPGHPEFEANPELEATE